jgi:hypothetical protein
MVSSTQSSGLRNGRGENYPNGEERTAQTGKNKEERTRIKQEITKPSASQSDAQGVFTRIPKSEKQKADPRHTSVMAFYMAEFSRRNPSIMAPLDGSDHKQLANFLRQQSSATVEQITGWLRNAFASDDAPPLRHGFRLREFCAHAAKYTQGPLKAGGNAKTTPTELAIQNAKALGLYTKSRNAVNSGRPIEKKPDYAFEV